MRIDDETGEPRAHLLPDPLADFKEAQLGMDELLRKAHLQQDREKRQRAAQKLMDDSAELSQRRIEKANALAARFEWLPVKAITLFERQTCRNCGAVNHMFRGFGTLFKQKASATHVIRRAECLDQGLPHEVRLIEEATEVCYDCVDAVAEPLEQPPYEFHPDRRD